VNFDIIQQGKTLLKLSDGNYLQITTIINKVLKSPQRNPAGEPIYGINASTTVSFWTPGEIAQLEESKSKNV